MSHVASTVPGLAAAAQAVHASCAAALEAELSHADPFAADTPSRPALISKGKEFARKIGGAFNDYSTAHLGIDFRALDPRSYASFDAGDAAVAGAMALSAEDGAAEEVDALDEATSVRTDPPPPPGESSLLKKVLNYYLNTPAISVPTIEMTVFALFASALHYAVSSVAAQYDPTIEPEFVVHSADKVAMLGLSFLGLATFFFGSNAYPKFMRPAVRSAIGLTKYLGRPMRWLGDKLTFRSTNKAAAVASLPGEALSFSGEMLMDPKMRENGFILGVTQEIKNRFDTTILEHPFLGRYTTGDARIWGAELLVNGLYVFPAVALSLGIPFFETVAPALGISFAATLSTARMSKVWGEDPAYMGRIVLGRTSIFAFANTVAPLAAMLLKTGSMSAGAGYLIQFGLTLAMSLGAMGLIRPPKGSQDS